MGKSSGKVNAGIGKLVPYKPGKPVNELTRELGITDIVKLASNENPRGPSDAVRATIGAGLGELSRYPDGSGYRLKAALANSLDIDPEMLTLGNGSNDVLELVARMALGVGDEGLVAEHSFVVYRLAVIASGAELVTVPARDYGADLDAMLAAITPRTRIVFLANPNNPTGTCVNRVALEAFLDAVPERVWVVLDEAYFEYVTAPDYPDGVSLLPAHPNLIVTRTFSKIHALAALRVGFAVSSPEVADLLNRLRQPFNVNALALAAAEAALADADFVRESREMNSAGMVQLTDGLARLNCPVIPSRGNFICANVGDANAVYEALLHRGVIVRPVAEYGLPGFLRITVGLPEENDRCLHALADVLAR